AAGGARRGVGLDRRPAEALGAPLRRRRRVPGGTEGATVTERLGHAVRIERTFTAPAEDVFDAWNSPEVMRGWYTCAPDCGTWEADVDLRVGGTVRAGMRR